MPVPSHIRPCYTRKNMSKTCLVLFLCAAFIHAQNGPGLREVKITVIDADLEIPLEGARVVSWDGTELVCDENGETVLSAPAERPVVVRIAYPGYESARLSLRPGIFAHTAALKLGGVMEEKELVVEAPKPETSKTVSGRSVAIAGRELTVSSETGIIGDVMNAVKLLPGVGYVGGYMAMPSVRGGEPSDVTAVFDGFYVERPYHWGGAFSIFDPKMIESAQLSHGVFSSRYGHTVSGLLEIRAKKPSPEQAGLELAVSSSATNLNLSFPLGKNGGAALMGKVTYWDPFIAFAKLFFEEVRYITTAPYIRSAAASAAYDFSSGLSLSVNGFFGGDGVGAHFDDYSASRDFRADFFWDNKIGFLNSALVYSPASNLVMKGSLGAGLIQSDLDAETYSLNRTNGSIRELEWVLTDRTYNIQARFDLDWEAGRGFLFAAGLEERYSSWNRNMTLDRSGASVPFPPIEVKNHGISTSLYSLVEYRPESGKFGVEFGLRGDHFLLDGKNFTLTGIPLFHPRLNFDFKVLEDAGPVDRLAFSVGTGLFSSVNSALQNYGGESAWNDTQNQSWTSVAGTKIDFLGLYAFTLEAYFKYVFNRSYTSSEPGGESGMAPPSSAYYFDGRALIWGFDLMLQKFQSRYWDGWISYSYIDSKYRDPQTASLYRNTGGWYYPDFHRFHTLNFILNYKPVQAVNLTLRLTLASGVPMLETRGIVQVPGSSPPLYERIQAYSDHSRMGPVIPLDIKLSIFSFNKKGKAKRELYISFENLLSLLYSPEGPKGWDENTGQETPGSSIASYDLPIPLVTFGIKWSF